ncbi:hypothetical protein [Sphingomonas crocodyli]|uniref:STAS/SEC14 domain-containing protein n=1 Tax=Sphingomonas crocodyli TaxID=1979270 RepID=A0A437M6M8_9SPHN|nr:hypothetical protein [Sphingomonas crocodyli]RVT93371.1 hypothetical protein EOD43_05690 [Sphingomonas crocodyli]
MQTASVHTSPDPSALSSRGVLTIAVDRVQNLIKVVGRGFWSVEHVAAHIREFEAVLIEARRSGQPSRTLVDLRDAPVQAPEVAGMLHTAMCRMYRPPERAAIIVASSLVKMQMKRGFNPATHGVFTSETAAELWLNAYHRAC